MRREQDDDEDAFRAFVNARWQALVATAWLVTADRQIAEDCVQEALVGVHRHWARIHRDGNPEAYARRAALNSALSWRRRRRIGEIPVENLPEVRALAQMHDEFDPELVAALRLLPVRMRAVVALRYVEDRSEAETAELLGCSVGTVKSASHKGLAKLRSALAPQATTVGTVAGFEPSSPSTSSSVSAMPSAEGGLR